MGLHRDDDADSSQTSLFAPEWLEPTQLHDERYLLGANGRRAEVTLEQRGSTFHLIADIRGGGGPGDAWHYEQMLSVELRLRHPTVATFNGHWRALPLDDNSTREGLIEESCHWLYTELCSDDEPQAHFDDDEALEFAEERQQISRLGHLLAQLAFADADVDALRVACTLTEEVQFFVYSAMLTDGDGRIRQMVATCPALFSLASGLCPHVGPGASLIADIKAGRPLNDVIRGALEPVAQRIELNEHAVALVRRAPSLPLQHLRRILQAPGLDLNDLHACAGSRRRWFEVMSTWGQLAKRLREPQTRRSFGSFVSRNALPIAERGAESTLTEILDWVTRGGGGGPTRATSLRRVLRDVEQWHSDLYSGVLVDPATPLAPPPKSARRVVGLTLEPITTVGDLIREGAEMQHCVASLAGDAIAGWVSIYRAEVDGTRATVAVVRECGGWGLMEASGRANAPLGEERLGVLRCWVDSLA
jgi:hypothetical protein